MTFVKVHILEETTQNRIHIKDYTYFVFKVQEKKCYAPSFLKAKSALSYLLHKRFNFMLT